MALKHKEAKNEDLNICNIDGWNKVSFWDGKMPLYYTGIFLGIILSGVMILLINHFSFIEPIEFKIYKKLYLLVFVIPLHELLHFLVLPKYDTAKFEISLKRLSFRTKSEGIYTRNRFVIISLAPLIILTIIPFFLYFFFPCEWLVYIMIYNILGSGLDIIYSLVLLNYHKNTKVKIIGSDILVMSSNQKKMK